MLHPDFEEDEFDCVPLIISGQIGLDNNDKFSGNDDLGFWDTVKRCLEPGFPPSWVTWGVRERLRNRPVPVKHVPVKRVRSPAVANQQPKEEKKTVWNDVNPTDEELNYMFGPLWKTLSPEVVAKAVLWYRAKN